MKENCGNYIKILIIPTVIECQCPKQKTSYKCINTENCQCK